MFYVTGTSVHSEMIEIDDSDDFEDDDKMETNECNSD